MSQGSKRNLGYTVSCKNEQEAKIIHDFLSDHAPLHQKNTPHHAKKKKRPEAMLSYPQLSTIQVRDFTRIHAPGFLAFQKISER